MARKQLVSACGARRCSTDRRQNSPDKLGPLRAICEQRAYFTAQALGIAERTHQALFDAVWKTGEQAIADPTTRRPRNPEPSLENAVRYLVDKETRHL